MMNNFSDKNFLWTNAKPDRVSDFIDFRKLKQAKPVFGEEPILPTALKPDLNIFNQIQSDNNDNNELKLYFFYFFIKLIIINK